MKTIIKSENPSKNLWRDGQNNYYQEIDHHMYPYDRFRNQILNRKIKFSSSQFDKIGTIPPVDINTKEEPFYTLSEDQTKKPISIVDHQTLARNALDGGS